jgi:TRAP-type C4-dicarboxylate transport system permease small subunit
MMWLSRLDHLLAAIERALIVFLFSGLIGLGFLQMLLRNLSASGLFWADELLRHAVVWLGMLGASLATREHRHLSFDVLPHAFPPWCRSWCTLLTNLVAALICILLCRAAWHFMQAERAAGTRLAFGVTTWVVQSIFPCGFLIMALRFLLHGLATRLQLARRSCRR